MLQSVKTFINDRRAGLSKTATVAAGFYLTRHYVKDRLEEVKDKLEQERLARDNLKRRFRQTEEDISYTVMALLPTLSEQILDEMDVESLTQELQSYSRTRAMTRHASAQSQRPPSSLASSIDVIGEHDARSDAGSAAPSSMASTSYSIAGSAQDDSNISTSGLQSWVETSGTPSLAHPHDSPAVKTALFEAAGLGGRNSRYDENASVDADSGLSDSMVSSSAASEASPSRSKAELWKEITILTFTRTLTTLYSTTLLSLLTTIQLTLLARSKYINSVLQFERDERLRERLQDEFSISKMLLGGGSGLEELMMGDMMSLLREDGVEEIEDEDISDEVQNKYLTLSWWILHVGWKDVGERVRRGVEEVFHGVSLKSKLAAIDLHRLLNDVRRRVEHEVTFEGNERRTNFLSTLLPSTPETTQHVLTQGGFSSPSAYATDESIYSPQTQYISTPPSLHTLSSPSQHIIHLHPHAQDAAFSSFLAETRSILASSDFSLVLEICLDRATDILFSGLEKSVFISSEAAPGEDVRIRLAGLLPGLARWSQLALNGLPNELVDNLLDVKEVKSLSAIIFSKFEDRFR